MAQSFDELELSTSSASPVPESVYLEPEADVIVARVNLPPTPKVPCSGCRGEHPSHAAMMAHLELGTCISGVKKQHLERWATESPEALSFIKHEQMEFLLPFPNYGSAPEDYYNPATWLWECPYCTSYGAYLREDLDHHMLTFHRDRPFLCPNFDCQRRLESLQELVAHVETNACGEHVWKSAQFIVRLYDHLSDKIVAFKENDATIARTVEERPSLI